MITDLKGGTSVTYEGLQEKYMDFGHPRAMVLLGDKAFDSVGKGVVVDDIHVELTAGYEASIASFRLYDSYDQKTGKFKFDKVSQQIVMGNTVTLQMGYLDSVETVFKGYISGVSFGYEPGSLPYIEITAMDIKGVMMGGTYAASLKASTYSAAVMEVLQRTNPDTTDRPAVTDTPDAERARTSGGGTKSSPITVEMVNESDYEFVVRAAKRYNYEFFVDRGKVIFRPAKNDTSILMKMGPRTGLQGFHIAYSVTGVVGEIEARAMNPGDGKVISANSKFNNTISTGSKAKKLVGKSSKVYVDASITSAEEAQSRVASLMEKMSYRVGSLEGSCVGIPDLVPGRFIAVEGLGVPVDNDFYLTTVKHDFSSEMGFSTKIEGCAAQIKTSAL